MTISLKQRQWEVFTCNKRFRVLVAGRRFGKTHLGLAELCQAAWGPGRLAWYVAPTYKQAKRIAWKRIKQLTRPYWAQRPSETDLSIELTAGGIIALRGADNYDSLRGDGLDFVVLDEYASMTPEAWTEVLRPALSDRVGRALFIGTPRGMNHFYELFQAQRDDHWGMFQFTTEQGGNVPREELEQATRELDERTFRQEFQATFEGLGQGLVYYAFDRQQNVRSLLYDPHRPLFWSLDFNVNQMCSVIGQRMESTVSVLDEIILPNSNTWEACGEFRRRTEKWLGQGRPVSLDVYGDASGDSRRSSADRTDWQIIREFLGRHADLYRSHLRVPGQNPPVKARVNALNALLCNYRQERRLLVDARCKELIKDFERVTWKADAHGNFLADLDKSDPLRTHVSDALGYFVVREFPLRQECGERSGVLL